MPNIVIDNCDWKVKKQGWGGPERIEFDIYHPNDRELTMQYLLYKKRHIWVPYNVEVERKRDDLHIKYSWDNNKHLSTKYNFSVKNFIEGVHILRNVIPGRNRGSSDWHEKPGPEWKIEKLNGGRRNRNLSMIRAIQRGDQGSFRQQLLDLDGCCAISGQTCKEALEAAHIVPAHGGRREVLSNGILLRADLHRLYDVNPPKFDICSKTGQVLAVGGFHYQGFDLNERRIDEGIRRRISEALGLRQDNRG